MVELIIENKKYVSTRLAAVLLKCTNDYAGKLAREGKIASIRHNNFWFIEEAAIHDYLRESVIQKSIQRKELSKQRENEYRNRTTSLKMQEKKLARDAASIPSLFSVKKALMVAACFVVLIATKFLASDAALAHVGVLDVARHISRNVTTHSEQIVSDVEDAVIGFGTATLKPVKMVARDMRYVGENYVAGIYTTGRSLNGAGEKINHVVAKIDQGVSHNTASAVASLDFAEKRITFTYEHAFAGISQAFKNAYDVTVNSVYAVGQSVIDAGKIYSKGVHVVADTITSIVDDEYYADQLAIQTHIIARAPEDNEGVAASESKPQPQDPDEDDDRDVVVVNRNPVIVQGISESYLERRLAIFRDSLDLKSDVTVVNKTVEGSRISTDRIYEDINESSDEAAENAVTGGDLSFSGIDGTFTGSVSVGGDLSVTGTTTLSGPLIVGGSSGIAGYVLQSTGTGAVWVATSTLGISSGGGTWGSITGTLADQTDLQTALDAKLSTTTAASTYVAQALTLNTLALTGNQTFATSTAGTDFNISSAAGVHTFNIPDASGSARGLLTSADWTTFNNKQAVITTGTTAQYLRGDLSLATFPTALSAFSNDSGFLTAETDPVYSGSSWFSTTNNASNWDTAYGWGDHSLAGYLTSFTELDPAFGASDAASITATDIINLSNLSGTNTGDQTIELTGDVTGSGTGTFAATLADTGVSPGSYTNSDITVDSKGRITSISNGTGGSGVTTMAAIGSSANANGATISGTTLTLQPASASFGGVVTTETQTFAGAKTFSSDVTLSGTASLSIGGNLLFQTKTGTNENPISTNTSDGSDNQSVVLIAGGTPPSGPWANRGAYSLMRGNEFTGYANQKGMLGFVAGHPGTSGTYDGGIIFSTGASETVRMHITRDGQIRMPIGTAALPSLAEHTDTDTGVTWLGSDVLTFSTAGTERLRLDTSLATFAYRISATSAVTATAPVVVTNTSAGSSNVSVWAYEALTPNIVNNSGTLLLFGKAKSTNNSAYLNYTHVADGSTSNRYTIGFYGNDNLVNVLASGNVGIGSNATAPAANLSIGSLTATATASPIDLSLGGTYGNGALGSYTNSKLRVYDDGTDYFGLGISSGAMEYRVSSASSHVFLRGSTESMRINSSSQVGIGTASPASNTRLDVVGTNSQWKFNFAPDGGTNWPAFVMNNTSGTTKAQGIRFQASGTNQWGWGIDASANNTNNFWLYNYVDSKYGMFFAPTTAYLSVGSGSNSASQLGVSGNVAIGSGYLSTAAPTNGLIVQGNVGLGTTAPDKVLEVNLGTTSALRLSYNDSNGSAATYFDTTISSVGAVTFNVDGSDPTFNFSDYVGIGGTPTFPLDVTTVVSSNQTYGYLNSSGTTGTTSGTNDYSIRAVGRIIAPEFNAVSDGRLKDINFDLDSNLALNLVSQLRPVSFNWKDQPDGQPVIGFIAQNVESVIPNAVSRMETMDFSDQRSLDYNQLVAVSIGAIQALNLRTADFDLPDNLGELIASGDFESVLGLDETGSTDILLYIREQIATRVNVLSDFVAVRITAMRAYVGDLFADKVTTNKLCIPDSNGVEVCLTGDQLRELLGEEAPEDTDEDEVDVEENDSDTGNGDDTNTGEAGGGSDTTDSGDNSEGEAPVDEGAGDDVVTDDTVIPDTDGDDEGETGTTEDVTPDDSAADNSETPTDSGDTARIDSNTSDSGTSDAGNDDSGASDASSDTGADSAPDSGSDTSSDSGSDSGSTPDNSSDSGDSSSAPTE